MIRELAPLTVALETVITGLERSFMQQRRFVGDAAHELKTAVAVLKSSLQLLTLKQRTALEYEQGIERCQLDCDRMEEAVAKMLTLARVETKTELPSARVATDLAQTLRQVAEQFESMAELKRLRILVMAEEAGDGRRRGGAVATAVLQPAFECLAAQSRRLCDTRRGAEQDGELAIEDDGDGIAPQDLPHVFDRFYRGDPSRSRNTGGTGLGLSICKAIVSRWQGTIEITSELGVGTRVMVHLPLSGVPSASVKVAVRN